MRGSEGLDFTPILTHHVFLLTTIFAIAGWFIAFIGQIVAQAQEGAAAHGTVGTMWFAIFLQLVLIIGVILTLATNSVAMHRFQISVFGAVALVFSVFGINQGIFTNAAALQAMSAGYLLISIANILWLLYFTSEENSLIFHLLNYAGTGGLTGPGRNGFRPNRRNANNNMQNGIGGGYGGGIGNNDYGAPPMSGGIGGGIGGGYDVKDPGMGMGMGAVNHGAMSSSQRSLGGGVNADSINSATTGNRGPAAGVLSSPSASHATQPVGSGASNAADTPGPRTPLIDNAPDGPPDSEPYPYRAKALYTYTASPDDPSELSFTKGETLEILDTGGKWWQAKRTDGTTGIAPSNYLQVI